MKENKLEELKAKAPEYFADLRAKFIAESEGK